jgi:hypothetical protein
MGPSCRSVGDKQLKKKQLLFVSVEQGRIQYTFNIFVAHCVGLILEDLTLHYNLCNNERKYCIQQQIKVPFRVDTF